MWLLHLLDRLARQVKAPQRPMASSTPPSRGVVQGHEGAPLWQRPPGRPIPGQLRPRLGNEVLRKYRSDRIMVSSRTAAESHIWREFSSALDLPRLSVVNTVFNVEQAHRERGRRQNVSATFRANRAQRRPHSDSLQLSRCRLGVRQTAGCQRCQRGRYALTARR